MVLLIIGNEGSDTRQSGVHEVSGFPSDLALVISDFCCSLRKYTDVCGGSESVYGRARWLATDFTL